MTTGWHTPQTPNQDTPDPQTPNQDLDTPDREAPEPEHVDSAGAGGQATPLVIAHLADPHLDGSAETEQRFAAVIDHLTARGEHLDLVIVAGDIIQAGEVPDAGQALEAVRQRLTHLTPYLLTPGNSDDSSTFTPDPRFVVPHRHLRIIALDTSIPGEMGGRIDPADVEWVGHAVAGMGQDEIAILVMHHPPVSFGHPVVDGWRALGATAELERLIAATPAVVATLVGHTHGATWATYGGKPLLVAPGIHSGGRTRLDALIGDETLIDTSVPPAYLLHTITGTRLVSQHVPIPVPADPPSGSAATA